MATSSYSQKVSSEAIERWVSWNGSSHSESIVTRSLTPNKTYHSLSKTWVRTPGWAALVAAGATLPENGFNWARTSIPIDPVFAFFPVSYSGPLWNQVTVTYTGGFGVGSTAPIRTTTYAELNAKALQLARGAQWNAPIFVAEAGKTADMVRLTATKLVSMYDHLRRGKLGLARWLQECAVPPPIRRQKAYLQDYARYGSKVASSYWLEWRYGWLPFVKDVYDAMETLMDVVDTPMRREMRVRGTIRRQSMTMSPDTLIASDSTRSLSVRGNVVSQTVESARVTWRLTVNSADLPARLGLLNPLVVAWELVPLSFAVDWFVPIGDYLDGLTDSLRFNHVSGTYGWRVDTYWYATSVRDTGTFKARLSGFEGRVGKQSAAIREKMTVSPAAQMRVLEFSKEKFQVKQMLSALALARQRFGRF